MQVETSWAWGIDLLPVVAWKSSWQQVGKRVLASFGWMWSYVFIHVWPTNRSSRWVLTENAGGGSTSDRLAVVLNIPSNIFLLCIYILYYLIIYDGIPLGSNWCQVVQQHHGGSLQVSTNLRWTHRYWSLLLPTLFRRSCHKQNRRPKGQPLKCSMNATMKVKLHLPDVAAIWHFIGLLYASNRIHL